MFMRKSGVRERWKWMDGERWQRLVVLVHNRKVVSRDTASLTRSLQEPGLEQYLHGHLLLEVLLPKATMI